MMQTQVKKSSTSDVVYYIIKEMKKRRDSGHATLTLISGEVHKDMGYTNAHPVVCSAMKKCMRSTDSIINNTDSGQSSTIEIKYSL